MAGAKRRTVALAIPELDFAGPDRVFYELLLALPRDRFDLVLITGRDGGRYFDALPNDVEKIVLPDPGRYPVRAFASAMDQRRPDLVMTTLRMNITAGYARLLQKRKIILIARQANAIAADAAVLSSRGRVRHAVINAGVHFALRRADVLVAQSQAMATELHLLARRAQRTAVIGNPVLLGAIDAAVARPAPAPRGDPAIVSVGRLAVQKGYDRLIDAMVAIRAARPGAHLTIYGEGPLREELEARIASHGLSEAISLPGTTDDVPARIAQADLFVSSSRYEGFSNALLEAMAIGLPVVATDCPGATREMVHDGTTGILVPDHSTEALAAGIGRALDDGAGAMGMAARDFVAQTYAREKIAAQYADLFDQVLTD